MEKHLERLADDLLVGSKAISTEIYGTPDYDERVNRMAREGALPTFMIKGLRCARRSTLRAHIERLEREAADAA